VPLASVLAVEICSLKSAAGMEASGTGNMKFAMNGALTVGTLDGANVEMSEEVGEDNIFIFGLRTDEVSRLKAGGYNPWNWYESDRRIRRVVDALTSDTFTTGEPDLFQPIRRALLDQEDTYLHLADFNSYVATQERISNAFLDTAEWSSKAILNVARMSMFSSDRTIQEYAADIWNVRSVRPS